MSTPRNTALAFTACALLAAPGAAQDAPFARVRSLHAKLEMYGQSRGTEQSDRFSKSFRVGPSGTLDLSNLSGAITVTGGSGDEVVINALKRVRERDAAAARQMLAAVTIDATERAGRVEVRTSHPGGTEGHGFRHPNVEVDYTVTVPSGATVYLKSLSGSIKVTNVRGELRQDTLSGDLQAADVGKIVRLKTMSGDVDLSNTAPDGEVNVSSLSGTVTLRNIKTMNLDASSVSGDLRLNDVACEHASLRSISGNIDFAGTLAKSGRYEIKSHSGNVRLAPGAMPGFELDAETFSGNTRSDLPLTLRAGSGTQEQRPRRGPFERRTLRGTFGDGSAVVQIRTFSGDVTVVKR